MIAEGRVAPDQVDYNDLPWKYSAGTPNILGVIVSAQRSGSPSMWSARLALRAISATPSRSRMPQWRPRWTRSANTPAASRAGH